MAKKDIADYFGMTLRETRILKGMSQENLALESELDRTYISMLERGIKTPTLTTLAKLAKALDVTSADFLAKVQLLESGENVPKTGKRVQGVSLFATSVSCGKAFGGEYSVDKVLSLDELLIKNPSETFFIKASGESMIPTIFDGDVLIVAKDQKPRNGSIILAQIDNEYTIKRFYKSAKEVRLLPDNPNFKEIVIGHESKFWFCGVVVGSARIF
jgi:DNA polymerase V